MKIFAANCDNNLSEKELKKFVSFAFRAFEW